MTEIESLITQFRGEAEPIVGSSPIVVVLADAPWLTLLAPLDQEVRCVPTPRHILELHAAGDAVDARDWYGLVHVQLSGGRHVLLRRYGAFDSMRAIVSVLTLAAAKSRQDIDEALTGARDRWREWRGREPRVRKACGETLPERKVPWSSLCLPSKLLHDIRSSVEAFAAARPLYQRMGLAYRRGLLFHGPPGNGKTLVCAAITTALQWPTIYVTADDRVDVGRELGSAFKQAADLAPVILCLEDIDALLNSSASLSAFLNRLDGCQAHEGLLVLATTNHPEKLDEALTSRPSRFDRIFHIGDPGLAQRQDYLGMLFGDHLSVTDRSEVAYVTEGMSMAFLKEILVSAATVAFSRGELPTRRDVDGALENLKQHRKQVVGGFMSRRSAGFAA